MNTSLVNRRSFLRGGLAVGAAVAIGTYASWPVTAPGRKVLSAGEATVVLAVATAMFPRGVMPLGGGEAGVVDRIDAMLDDWLPAPHRLGFRGMLRALEWGTMASRGTAFSLLPLADRQEVLEVWGDPSVMPRRILYDALKMAFGIAYFSHPQVVDSIGWRNTCGGGVA